MDLLPGRRLRRIYAERELVPDEHQGHLRVFSPDNLLSGHMPALLQAFLGRGEKCEKL